MAITHLLISGPNFHKVFMVGGDSGDASRSILVQGPSSASPSVDVGWLIEEMVHGRDQDEQFMRRKDRLSIELVLQSPEQYEQRLARNGEFYAEINTKGLRLA